MAVHMKRRSTTFKRVSGRGKSVTKSTRMNRTKHARKTFSTTRKMNLVTSWLKAKKLGVTFTNFCQANKVSTVSLRLWVKTCAKRGAFTTSVRRKSSTSGRTKNKFFGGKMTRRARSRNKFHSGRN